METEELRDLLAKLYADKYQSSELQEVITEAFKAGYDAYRRENVYEPKTGD